MTIADLGPLSRKLAAFVSLTPHELSVLDALHARRRRFDAGHELMREGQKEHPAFILTAGWSFSYKRLPDGSRQVTDFQVPGDVLGLHSLLLQTADCGIRTVTDVDVSEVSSGELLHAMDKSPRLTAAVLWMVSREAAIVSERLVDLGRRDAKARIAHLLLEIGARLSVVGMASPTGYCCPLSQYLLADALGLTAIHLNRVLRQLREADVLTFRKGVVEFVNLDALVGLAQHDDAYLDQPRSPPMHAGSLVGRMIDQPGR